MNPSTDAFAWRKRQRIELEVGVAEAPMLHCATCGLDDQDRERPEQDFAFLVLAFGATGGPIRLPQPRRERIRFHASGLLFQEAVAADRCVDEATADTDKDQAEEDCGDYIVRFEICAADELGVNEGKTPSQKRKSEESQESGRTLGRLGHSLILGVFEGIERKPQTSLLSRLHLALGTGQRVIRG